MQNKGLIKFFAIVFALVCIYQLTFTYVSHGIQNDAKAIAKGDTAKEVAYLEQMKDSVVYLGYTYEEVSDKQINKGLDLEGGINVMLEISVREIIHGLANNSTNPVLNKALDQATKEREGNQDYLDAFFIAFDKVSNGSVKLASPELFTNKVMDQAVNTKMTDNEVKAVLKKKVAEAVDSAFGVLTERIDKFGVVQPNIQKIGESGRIMVELPGAKDIDRVKKLLQSTAQLEFWEAYKVGEMQGFLMQANQTLIATEKKVETTETKTTQNDSIEKLLGGKDSLNAAKKGNNPLFDKLMPNQTGGGPVLGYASTKDTAAINGYLKRADIRSSLTGEQRFARFAWGKEAAGAKGILELYALKGNKGNVAPLGGNVITGANANFDQQGRPSVEMQMSPRGAVKWEEMTGKAYTQQGFIAIVLDNVVYSAPGVTTGPISGGNSQITGSFDVTETKDLANILRAGKLPAKANIVQSEVVGPSLGQEAIDNGIMSSIVGLLLVSLWMVVYYGKAGWYANVALIVNLLFLFGVLASFGAVLTLPGIAGIVLTMGTAVDANIIIYERAKEELRAGRTLDEAVKISYSWRGAMSSITDANVTHVLTGLVLLIFGTGPVKGFATTLLIGIFTSLFTSIFIARLFLDHDIRKGNVVNFVTGMSKNWFTNFHFNFLGAKKFTYIFSSLVVVVSCISFYVNGLDQGIDFVGGRSSQVKFEKTISVDAIKQDLETEFDESVDVKIFGNNSQVRITTKYMIQDNSAEADAKVNQKLYNALKKHYPSNLTEDQFVNIFEGKTLGILSQTKVTATVADDIKANSVWAVLGSMAIVFIYLMVSFRKWQYSLGAIAAVAHDVIFVLGIYSLCYKFMPFHMEMDQHFIAAILTVIGYSMNDTVIVFDRVREYLAGKTKGKFADIVNASVNTTMSRTINTSLTMVLVLLIMFVFGGDSIRGFIFAMLVGIIVGTYSSLFIATPVLVDTVSKADKDKIEHAHNDEVVVAEKI
ncbi:protein translocase subunit SecDF [uncultured Flavobacterium sp.]|uniref:protein translocase subunit SecDF n=1 Tax=uncultured Flavobacterium sp. TaxID=165435 RepID=UPI0025D3EBBB|nr:protein translocase subunit SecDF [uncultured Flavobacterium sp.]